MLSPLLAPLGNTEGNPDAISGSLSLATKIEERVQMKALIAYLTPRGVIKAAYQCNKYMTDRKYHHYHPIITITSIILILFIIIIDIWSLLISSLAIFLSLLLVLSLSLLILLLLYRWTWIWRTTVWWIICLVSVRCISSLRHMYTTDFAYDGPNFLVPLSPSYPSSPVLSTSRHGLSQQGVWVPFWTPKHLKRTP